MARRTTPTKPASAHGDSAALALAWREWVIENLCSGRAPGDIVAGLRNAGVPAHVAKREVAELANSPGLAVALRLTHRLQRLELVAALARHHAGQDPFPTEIERRTLPSATEFYRDYFATQRPVVFTDVAARWPARNRWSLAYFRRILGHEIVDVVVGRAADPRYDQNTALHAKRMPLAKYLDLVAAAGHSNDLYLVANNHAMAHPAFARLLNDVRIPDGIIVDTRPTATSLWIGPAGTVTPLHHDTTNILFSQLVGRKRFELIAPTETVLMLDPMDSFYSPVDLDQRHRAEHPALRALQVRTVELGPGDTLFLPAGWWHRVSSLDVSISFSLLGFAGAGAVDWYRPGLVGTKLVNPPKAKPPRATKATKARR
ncbi:MAG: cupin-like domain-containing protein [Kofleriaceae bacterium]|nr:cupin-like domain-containing protein [Kofleriaceae bacterium]